MTPEDNAPPAPIPEPPQAAEPSAPVPESPSPAPSMDSLQEGASPFTHPTMDWMQKREGGDPPHPPVGGDDG